MQITIYIEGKTFLGLKTPYSAKEATAGISEMLASERPQIGLSLEDGSTLLMGSNAFKSAVFQVVSLPGDKIEGQEVRVKKVKRPRNDN